MAVDGPKCHTCRFIGLNKKWLLVHGAKVYLSLIL